MPDNVALIAGATGAVALRLTEMLAAREDWQVVGLCRRPPAEPQGVRWIAVDLLDDAQTRAKLADCREVTHAFYAARGPHGESGQEPVAENLAMLRNVVDAVDRAAPGLRHVHLVEGGKYYGQHLGPYKTPTREDDPRHMPPDFYYDQEDWLVARAAERPWSWSATRPNVICDFSPGRARNMVSIIAAWGTLCRAQGLALDFPGKPGNYTALTEVTEARHLARAMLWMASEPRCADQAFNLTNGDLFRWANLWPRFAEYFGVPLGGVRPLRLADWMAGMDPVWQRIVAKHGLRPTRLEDLALWGFADFVWGQEHDVVSDTTKLLRYGFHETVNSEAMFLGFFDDYRRAGLIP